MNKQTKEQKKAEKAISEIAVLRDASHSLAIQFKDNAQIATFYEAQDSAYGQAIRVVMAKFGMID